MKPTRCLFVIVASLATFAPFAHAGDWPMWRYGAGRGNSSPDAIPANLHMHWVRTLPKAQTAWPKSQPRLQFDAVPQPIVVGSRIIVPSTVNDNITAFDTKSGKELWRFYAEAPVRFAPVGYKDNVYFVSDDGHLYCVHAADGKLQWKVNGGPVQRWIIGNHRLTSSWPARGGPVLHQGKIYFTASIWPFMGIFVHAVDPDTGKIVWTNSGDGTNWTVQPHGAPSFATVAPQGHLTATGNFLVVPGGRSTPAVFDTRDGKLVHFKFDGRNGGQQVTATEHVYYLGKQGYLAENGSRLSGSAPSLIDDELLIFVNGGSIKAESVSGPIKETVKKDRRGKKTKVKSITRKVLFQASLQGSAGDAVIRAGTCIFTGGKDKVAAFELGKNPSGSFQPIWSEKISGTVDHMLAADDRLFVVTKEGQLFCFGSNKKAPVVHENVVSKFARAGLPLNQKVTNVLAKSNDRSGFAIIAGISSLRLIEELLLQSQHHLIVVDPDQQKVNSLRRQMQAAGLYGKRIAAYAHEPATFAFPPYLASLIFCGGKGVNEKLVTHLSKALRPYGGRLYLMEIGNVSLGDLAKKLGPEQFQSTSPKEPFDGLVRSGPLPNTDDWTHQYGNPAQTAVSKDRLVKAPLGLLWFGGPSHEKILPRHGHGPSPQVAGGRLFIEGPDMLRAVDVYTGRVLWEKTLKDFGKYYNTTRHFPGAGEIGSNYVSLQDKVYAVYGNAILELDSASGKLTREFKLQVKPGQELPNWGFIAVWKDYLVATSSPVPVKIVKDKDKKKSKKEAKPKEDPSTFPAGRYASGSRRLIVFNRKTGKLLWSREAQFNFRHNNIAIGAGIVFCVDALTEARKKALSRRGVKLTGQPALLALSIETGKEIWSTNENVFGTFLNYSAEHDIVIQAGSRYRDRAGDEVSKGMAAFRGKDGKVLWNNSKLSYGGPCLLWRDKILTNGSGGFAIDIKTGKETGWKYKRNYGCNTALGSEYLLTFRSGCAGFFDLDNDSGTANLGGFRSSCTNNLIAANGVLNAPDYTRTCSCAYQNQTSLALVHMPEAEFWTFGGIGSTDKIGINFGAPGDRRAPNGTLWQAKSKIAVEPAKPEEFRVHSSFVQGDELKWVAACGVKGVKRANLKVPNGRRYRVKLLFLEPDEIKSGKRVFDVKLQGNTVLAGFDIVQNSGSAKRALVREFNVDAPFGAIVIEFAAKSALPPVISGVEVIQQ